MQKNKYECDAADNMDITEIQISNTAVHQVLYTWQDAQGDIHIGYLQ